MAARAAARALSRADAAARGELRRLLVDPLLRQARPGRLLPPRQARPRAHSRGRGDPRFEPPQLPGPVRARHMRPAADLLHGQAGDLQEPVRRVAAQLPRRVPRQARRVRRRVHQDHAGPPRARRGGGDLPRGHENQARIAGTATARRRPDRARERRTGGSDRRVRQRARAPRLAHQACEGAPALRRAAHLPARGEPLAIPGRGGHRADLAVRGAPVGVARRPAAAAHRGRGGRRIDGHGGGRGPRARGPGGTARVPHEASRRTCSAPRARTPPTCRESDSTARSSRARCATWSSPGWTSWCSRCPAARCPRPSARSAPGWASAAPCSWPRRASCRHSARPPPPSWPSASGRARSPRWQVPRTRAKP